MYYEKLYYPQLLLSIPFLDFPILNDQYKLLLTFVELILER